MKSGFVYLRPLNVAFVRSTGPYGTSAASAWGQMFDWLDRTGLLSTVGTGYGLLLDDPRTIEPHLCRYDACVELTEEIRARIPEHFSIRRLPGGAYARDRHVGGTAGLADAISNMRHSGIEASGLHVDPRRPLIEIYFDNPRVVPAEKQRIDICMPVAVDEAFGRTAA
ncbi:MAG: GyrI-like domain-containing protein [Hyphomicrobium sp.]|nr:GyrI-like domain-containing protein [Hyphomicrobium sp.]